MNKRTTYNSFCLDETTNDTIEVDHFSIIAVALVKIIDCRVFEKYSKKSHLSTVRAKRARFTYQRYKRLPRQVSGSTKVSG